MDYSYMLLCAGTWAWRHPGEAHVKAFLFVWPDHPNTACSIPAHEHSMNHIALLRYYQGCRKHSTKCATKVWTYLFSSQKALSLHFSFKLGVIIEVPLVGLQV